MGLRKAAAYSKKKVKAFTRFSKKRQKSYIKMVPSQKIVKFTMGKESLFKRGKLPHHLIVVSAEKIQIRDNALEACRQFLNKKMENEFIGQYLFKVLPFPHHIQRENKMFSGASKGERVNTGMALSYGKSSGKAAILKPNDKIFFFALEDEKAVNFTRKIIKQVKPKLACRIKILYTKLE